MNKFDNFRRGRGKNSNCRIARSQRFNKLQGLVQCIKCFYVCMWIHICMSMPVCIQTQFFFSPFVLSTYSRYQKRRKGSLFESRSRIREHLQLVFIPKCCYVYNLQMLFHRFKYCIMIWDLSINSFMVLINFLNLHYLLKSHNFTLQSLHWWDINITINWE